MNQESIRSSLKPNCVLCGSTGTLTYDSLRDNLFGAPGEWGMRRCNTAHCRLFWLTPCPLEVDLEKAYVDYYTHGNVEAKTLLPRLISTAVRTTSTILSICTGQLAKRNRHDTLYLDDTPTGRLLDIGCGDGTFLCKMRSLGWFVQGMEFDPKAAQKAREKTGIDVRVGSLHDCAYSDESFDAVVMRHVLEHVYSPIEVLREVKRILRPNGRLIVVTPNAESLGHKIFRENWRGLEPPRHLHLFSVPTLKLAATKAGFEKFSAFTSSVNAWGFFNASYTLKYLKSRTSSNTRPREIWLVLKSMLLQIRETFSSDNFAGEECVLICNNVPVGTTGSRRAAADDC